MTKIKKLEEIEKKIENGEEIKIDEVNTILIISKEHLHQQNERCTRIFSKFILYLWILFILSPFVDKTEANASFMTFILIFLFINNLIFSLNYIYYFITTKTRIRILENYKENLTK